MQNLIEFHYSDSRFEQLIEKWKLFLSNKEISQPVRVSFEGSNPIFIDQDGRKFQIDFVNDSINYNKRKLSINKEPLARALGAGQKGLRLLDLSAGLGVDSIFLYQLGFNVTGIERNPLIYMALKIAEDNLNEKSADSKMAENKITFIYDEAMSFMQSNDVRENFDIAYFDPMFPEKKKSALPKQEMIFFKKLVGQDSDALNVIEYAVTNKLFKRFVVKRPAAAEPFLKPSGCIEGKIIRYDIYG